MCENDVRCEDKNLFTYVYETIQQLSEFTQLHHNDYNEPILAVSVFLCLYLEQIIL